MLRALKTPLFCRAGALLADFRLPLPAPANRRPESSSAPLKAYDDLAKFGLFVIDEHPEVDRDLIGLALVSVGARDEDQLYYERLM